MTSRKLLILFSLVAFISLQGCTLLKSRPAEHAGFLPKPELVKEVRDRAPFNGYWVYDGEQYTELRKQYGKVYVAPVDTEVVRKLYLASSGSEDTKMERIQEAEELANYFRESLILRLKKRAKMREENDLDVNFQIVDKPGPGVLSLRLALVQVVPTNPGVNLVGTAAGFFVPGGGLIKLAGEGSVAMEGFIHEVSPESDLYEEFKDREGQKSSLFSVKDYQRYAHIRTAIDDWTQQLVSLLSTPHDVMIDDSTPLSLNPL